MELVEQHRAPQFVEFLVRIGQTQTHRGRRRPQLGLAQQAFTASIAALGAVLGGENPTVVLQIELSQPDGGLRIVRLGFGEEGLG